MGGHNDKRSGKVSVAFLIILTLLALVVSSFILPPMFGPPSPASLVRRVSSDIKLMELSFHTMFADTGLYLNEYFDPEGLRDVLGFSPSLRGEMTIEQFEMTERVYSRTIHALLAYGSGALEQGYVSDDLAFAFHEILNEDNVKKLTGGNQYPLEKDRWGEDYRFWPGPWPEGDDAPPIPFRMYRPSEGYAAKDTPLGSDPWLINAGGKKDVPFLDTGQYIPYGYPAPKDKLVYIYSTGADRVSGQALFGGPLAPTNYGNENPNRWGGGDDINNWDKDGSWRSLYKKKRGPWFR